MSQISIQDLKANLSRAVAEAEAGDTIIITRHNEPVAALTSVRVPHVHQGSRVGKGQLRPAVRRGTGGRSLEVLLEDRGDR
jgi:prevent-host-death family protein